MVNKDSGKTTAQQNTATLLLILIILWMAVIFGFSTQPGPTSMQTSGFVYSLLSSAADKLFNNQPPVFVTGLILQGDHYIRKAGHFIEYLILGCLCVAWARRQWRLHYFRVSLLICVLYAVTDEVHQLFVPGRAGLASDVLLDSSAALVGMSIITAIGRLRRRKG